MLLPSTMTTQSVESLPKLLEAVHLYFPESDGWQLMISMVMTPSVWVMGNLSVSRGLPALVQEMAGWGLPASLSRLTSS